MSENKEKGLTLISKEELQKANEIDTAVGQLLSSNLTGFALLKAKTKVVTMISEVLTKDVAFMTDIRKLQGKQYGFQTDCKKTETYPDEVVINCLTEAILRGVEPTGNQFNILGGNCYITKNGVSHILKKLGVHVELSYALSKETLGQVTKVTTIEWVRNGKPGKKVIEFPVKVYKGVTTEDAIQGKAERKAKAWLIEHLTGIDIGDGEKEHTVDGGYAEVVKEEPETQNTSTGNNNTTAGKEEPPKVTITKEEEKPPVQISKAQQERFDKHVQKAVDTKDLEAKAGEVCKGFKCQLSDLNLEMYNFMKEKFANPGE